MTSPILQGLGALDLATILAVMLAVVLSQIVAIIPGLGGAFLLAVILPFVFGLEPMLAIAILIGATATDGTGNGVTSIIFGVPGSPTGVATTFDGYPMAKKGLAGRAIGASMAAAAVGGILGAIALAVMIPVVRPIVLSIGAAEFFILVVVALFAIAYVREEALMKGLVAGGLGLSLSFIGMEGSSGVTRFTFGQLYLWDGLQLVPFMIGLFAIAEMLELTSKGGTIADEVEAEANSDISGAWQGVLDVFRHWRVTLRGSLLGVWIGILPGLGGSAAQFMAYAQAARAAKDPDPPFGEGNVQGIIASDAATNSKDGGALIPTLAFGIPGSSSMAILLAGLVTLGVQPGPNMLEENLDILWMIIFVLVFANVFAATLVILFANTFAKLTYLRAALIAPPVLVISLFGAYATTRQVGDVVTAIAVGVIGYYMKKYGYSRATLVIGFVLGPLLERYLQQSLQLFGPWFLFNQPIALSLLIGLVLLVMWSMFKAYLQARESRTLAELPVQGKATGEEAALEEAGPAEGISEQATAEAVSEEATTEDTAADPSDRRRR